MIPTLSTQHLALLPRAQLFRIQAMLLEILANPATPAGDRSVAQDLLAKVRAALHAKPPAP